MFFKTKFQIANPSPDCRSDFVEVDLDRLNLPDTVKIETLALYRLGEYDRKDPVPFQVDNVAGPDRKKQIMVFYCQHANAGADDYSRGSASFQLEESDQSSDASTQPSPDVLGRGATNLRLEYHYSSRVSGGHTDSVTTPTLVPGRDGDIAGIWLKNGLIEAYVRLNRLPNDPPDISYTGSSTTIQIPEAPANLLNFAVGLKNNSPARWGQLTDFSFPPPPWCRDHQKVSLEDKDYSLISSNVGPLRATCTLRSSELSFLYADVRTPDKATLEIPCHLYRVFSVYPWQEVPYYTEDIFVLSNEGLTLSFRPHFRSCMEYVDCHGGLSRLEHIPDYFSIRQYFYPLHYLYGFAADAHSRGIRADGNTIRWRLTYGHNIKCTHLFMKFDQAHFDPLTAIGHYCWYKQLLKPMRLQQQPTWPVWSGSCGAR